MGRMRTSVAEKGGRGDAEICFLRPRLRVFVSPRLLIYTLALLVVCALSAHASGIWARQKSGTLAWLHALYFLDQNRGWAVGGNGALLVTTDGGATWQVMRRPAEDTLHDIYFSDAKNGWLVCERSIYLLRAKDEPRTYLLHTTDGGATWKRVNVAGGDVDVRLVRVVFTSGGRGWAFGEEGVLYTTRDGGATWARQRVPTRHLLLGGVFIDDDQGWLVGAGATVLQTSDGGETWRAGKVMNFAGIRFNATSFVDGRRGWAVGSEGHVFATIDGGYTWHAQESNVNADLLDVKFLDANEGWAVGVEGTVIHTMDGGAHWVTEPSGTTHPLERVCFIGREHGWAVGFGGTIIAYTTNAPAQEPKLKSQN